MGNVAANRSGSSDHPDSAKRSSVSGDHPKSEHSGRRQVNNEPPGRTGSSIDYWWPRGVTDRVRGVRESVGSLLVVVADHVLQFVFVYVLECGASDRSLVDFVGAIDDTELPNRFVEICEGQISPDPVGTTVL